MILMEAKDVLLKLRTEHGLSQETLAEKLFVTRQAVSRWERGDTLPNTETLKLLFPPCCTLSRQMGATAIPRSTKKQQNAPPCCFHLPDSLRPVLQLRQHVRQIRAYLLRRPRII